MTEKLDETENRTEQGRKLLGYIPKLDSSLSVHREVTQVDNLTL